MKTCRVLVISIAGLGVTLGGLRVLAQDALGTGQALDRNLDPYSGGLNTSRVAPNFRDRNLLVTGDVIGGRGFRGSVGYTASRDFRGNLGSNDLFDFRAASAISSPQLFGLGTTYQQVRLGQDIGLLEYRRANSGAAASIDAQNPMSPEVFGGVTNSDRMQLDRLAAASSIQQVLDTAAEPRLVGITSDEKNQPLLFQASNLRGLTLEPMSQSVGTIGLTSLDAVRIKQDVEAGGAMPRLGAQFETNFQVPVTPLLKPEAPEDEGQPKMGPDGKPIVDKRVNTAVHADYDRILQRIADRYTGRAGDRENLNVEPELVSQLGEDYKALRQQLSGANGRPGDPVATDRTTDGRQTSESSRSRPEREPGAEVTEREPGAEATDNRIPMTPKVNTEILRDAGEPQSNQPGTEYETASRTPEGMIATDANVGFTKPTPRTVEDFGVILRHGERIESLSGEQKDRFNELMASAEQKLREGDYFWAERRFERAMRFWPGHPLASVGSAHAQIGAGLYLSASLSLRHLLANHPEMIDVTYAPDLLPKRERLDEAATALKARLEGPTDQAAYAFLLAYIGHQLGDRELVKQNLELMIKHDPGNALAPLLKSIWLAVAEDVPAGEAQK